MQKKTRKQYRAEFKAKLVKEMLKEEKTVGQLAAEYEVHISHNWSETRSAFSLGSHLLANEPLESSLGFMSGFQANALDRIRTFACILVVFTDQTPSRALYPSFCPLPNSI